MKKIISSCLFATCALIAAGNTPASVYDARAAAFLKEHFGVKFGDPIEKFPQEAYRQEAFWRGRQCGRVIPVIKRFQYFDKAIGFFDDGKLTRVEFFAHLDKKYSRNSCIIRIYQTCSDLCSVLGLPEWNHFLVVNHTTESRSLLNRSGLDCTTRYGGDSGLPDYKWGCLENDGKGFRRMGIWISADRLSSRLRAEQRAREIREQEEFEARENAAGEELPAWK